MTILMRFLVLVGIHQVWRMALPPKDKMALRVAASRIIVGKVQAVFSREVDVENGTDTEYVALLATEKDETTRQDVDKTLPPLMYVHFRQAGKRPRGWTGDVGQSSPLGEGEHVRVYLKAGLYQKWQLLEPNGWEEV